MKNKGLILSSILLVVLFSALVFFTIRLFNHPPASSSESEATVKKTAVATDTPANRTTDRPMVEKAATTAGQTAKKVLPPPKPPETKPAPADTEENRREIARMKEQLPGNMWIPEDPRYGADPERSEQLGKSIILADKIRKGTATPEEKVTYYNFKIKAARDRIDIIKYIADRTAKLHQQDQKSYLTEQDRVVGEQRVLQLEKEINGYNNLLEALKTETGSNPDE